LFLSIALILACTVSTAAPAASPAFDPTKAALELQGTAMSLQLTQAAINSQQQEQPVVAEPTNAPAPTAAATTEIPAVPTADVEARIKAAKVLVYENTDERGIGMWVQDALDGMGMKYTQTGSYSGHFMENLDSGIKWDLIIVDAEDKDRISGEFWDVINMRLSRDKALRSGISIQKPMGRSARSWAGAACATAKTCPWTTRSIGGRRTIRFLTSLIPCSRCCITAGFGPTKPATNS
jgi:hypothetical protein